MTCQTETSEWWNNLENVLHDGDACNAFMEWIQSESSIHTFKLHFSIVAFKQLFASQTENAIALASEIFDEYLSREHGLCLFVDSAVRDRVEQKLKHRSSVEDRLFDECVPYVDKYLRKQHEQFLQSEQFIQLLNSACDFSSDHITAPSTSDAHMLNWAKKSHRKSEGTKLTSKTLLRSQHDRGIILGKSSVERMFGSQPTSKFPYTCHATTSANDSAISSNVSSEKPNSAAHNNKPHLHAKRAPAPKQTSHKRWDQSPCFRHDSEEGRRLFADQLISRLNKLDERLNRTEQMNEQIKRIDRLDKLSARELVRSAGKSDSAYDLADEEDDLDSYVKRRMFDESNKASPSQQSPAADQFTKRRISPGSLSPDQAARHSYNKQMSWSMAEPANEFVSFKPRKSSTYDEDTSGIGSMATTYVSSSTLPMKKKYHALVYQKARELSASYHNRGHDSTRTMKLTYKPADGVPMVAYVPKTKLTLREFRKYMSIPSKARKRLYFKTKAEEGAVLMLVEEDGALLPSFEGGITAEGRPSLSDSD